MAGIDFDNFFGKVKLGGATDQAPAPEPSAAPTPTAAESIDLAGSSPLGLNSAGQPTVTREQQAARDKDRAEILGRELVAAQERLKTGDPRAQGDIEALQREIAGAGGAKAAGTRRAADAPAAAPAKAFNFDDYLGPVPGPKPPPAPEPQGLFSRAAAALAGPGGTMPPSEQRRSKFVGRGSASSSAPAQSNAPTGEVSFGTPSVLDLIGSAAKVVTGYDRINDPPPGWSVLDRAPQRETPEDLRTTPLENLAQASIAPGAEEAVRQRLAARGVTLQGQRSPGAVIEATPQTLTDKAVEATRGATGSDALARGVRSGADAWLSAARIVPETAKLATDITQLVTLGLTKPLSEALDHWDRTLGNQQSYEQRAAAQKFQAMLANGNVSQAKVLAFLLDNPEFTLNTALPSAGSMAVGAGGAKAAQHLALRIAERRGLVGAELAAAGERGAELGANLTNAAMNAGDTFDQTDGSIGQKLLAAAGAGAGTMAVGRLTEGGAEKRVTTGARRLSSNPVADRAAQAGITVTKESGQEYGEQVSQDASQQLAEGKVLDPAAIGRNATAAAVQGWVLGGPAGLATSTRGVARDSIISAVDDAAARYGLAPKAAAALREAVVKMTPDEAVHFIEHALTGMEKRNLVRKAGIGSGFRDALQQKLDASQVDNPVDKPAAEPAPAAATAHTAPAAEEDDGTGLADTTPRITTPVDEAAHQAAHSPTNDRPEPTDAQKEAGNYQKGHVRIGGLDIAIENPQGSQRRGTAPDGTQWETTLTAHYGYVKGTLAGDGDHSDVFVKPGTSNDYAGPVFVIDQVDPKTGKFDEHKSVIGASSEDEARRIYLSNYDKGWQGLGAITQLPIEAYRSWVKDGTKRKALGKIDERVGDLAGAAGEVAAAGDGGGDQPGRGGRAVGPVPAATGRVGGTTEAPAASSQPAAAVADGGRADAALSPEPVRIAVYEATSGEQALSDEHADRTLEHLQEQARRGKFNRKRFAQSDFGAKLSTGAMQALAPHLERDPVGTLQALRDRLVERKGDAGKAKAQADLDAAMGDLGDLMGKKPAAPAPAAARANEATAAPVPAPAAPPPRTEARGTAKHPKTVMGSRVLASVSEKLGGLDPAWLSEFSHRQETARKGKDGRPVVAWRNPMVTGVGTLFRRGGTQDLQQLAELMEAEGYLPPGSVERDAKAAGEQAKELVRSALNREEPKTTDQQEAEHQAAADAEREAYYAELDAEAAREAEAERQAIMAANDIEPAELDAMNDDDIAFDAPAVFNQDAHIAGMRAMGFTDQEIADDLAQRQGTPAAVGPGQTRQDGPQATPPPDAAGGPAPGNRAEAEQEAADQGLTLSSQTPDELRAKTEREQSALDGERRARAAEQERLRREQDQRDIRARADATVDDFQLGQSAEQQLSGMDDLFAPPREPSPPQPEPEPPNPAALPDSAPRELSDAEALAQPERFAGRPLEQQVLVGDTGQVAKLKMDAHQALQAHRERLDALKRLRECLGAAA